MLVFDQAEAHEAVAVLTEADSRRDRYLGLGQQELGELQRPHGAEGLGDGRPDEHRRARLGEFPSASHQPLHQHVAPAAIDLVDFGSRIPAGPLRAAIAATWTGVNIP